MLLFRLVRASRLILEWRTCGFCAHFSHNSLHQRYVSFSEMFFSIQYPSKLEYLYYITPSYDIGARFPEHPLYDAILVLSSPPDACKPLKNVMDVYGSVVLVERGRCSFTDKVLNAERAGASFVIVSDVLNATDDLIEMVRDENDARARAGIPVAYLNGASGSVDNKTDLTSNTHFVRKL
ncbi:hypothetical protein L596_003779 [Steinernema carpocapsae]|uniref:PA domain-containing protein n=1 Tax=Steinernema carpocapsae TaxID=34508 RepID=A0A4U8UTQ3_STECR|nr:hypothetical protein L596_003779 [Steinernema carpocapsae]